MKSDDAIADVVIVGGGFSGTMAAAQLVRRGLSVVLVEGGGRAGLGTAYSTREAVHLLNVPAETMSAWPDAPDDFVEAGHEAGAFAPRREFGTYLRAILDQAVADGVELVAATAVSAVREDDWRIALDDGRNARARALVLAQGNQPPAPMRVAERIDPTLFINNPWGSEARAAIERVAGEWERDGGGDVLILGTGLTMVDLVLSLSVAGHGGRIVALSRRGQVPRGHAAHVPAPVTIDEVPQGNVLALWRWLRARSGAVGWRAAVDALRPHAQLLWRGLGEGEQERFLRHARPHWEAHRHRIAPQVAEQLRAMIGEGRLEVAAGRISAVREEKGELVVNYTRRGSPTTGLPRGRERRFSAVFNCTGPSGGMGRTGDPLLRQMIDDRLIAADRLGIGLGVDRASRAGELVWALGPLTKSEFWEIVAVPDIRGQVAGVADDIARELR